ncbi:MAG TPA: 50S ribosomal protein L13 [Candidatus Dormibacteraeota bacterium]|jgi:large subunit ribosomal protein L13|nr:50S ribosomal protein L13 [Candidatus Dormibacteraeota bacterium]
MITKTYTPKASDLKPRWYVVDADGQTLGRLASNIAKILKGKHNPGYAPHVNTGDFVVVVNAAKVHVTGSKRTTKTYERYSGYPSGRRTRTFEEQMARRPEEPLRNAVKGMLQHNTLGEQMLKRLKIYAGAEHEQSAQQPQRIRFTPKGEIERIGD